ncbi:MAG: hypothetical protein ACOYJ2_01240 [Rickettsiales bacterium]
MMQPQNPTSEIYSKGRVEGALNLNTVTPAQCAKAISILFKKEFRDYLGAPNIEPPINDKDKPFSSLKYGTESDGPRVQLKISVKDRNRPEDAGSEFSPDDRLQELFSQSVAAQSFVYGSLCGQLSESDFSCTRYGNYYGATFPSHEPLVDAINQLAEKRGLVAEIREAVAEKSIPQY